MFGNREFQEFETLLRTEERKVGMRVVGKSGAPDSREEGFIES